MYFIYELCTKIASGRCKETISPTAPSEGNCNRKASRKLQIQTSNVPTLVKMPSSVFYLSLLNDSLK